MVDRIEKTEADRGDWDAILKRRIQLPQRSVQLSRLKAGHYTFRDHVIRRRSDWWDIFKDGERVASRDLLLDVRLWLADEYAHLFTAEINRTGV